MRYSIQKDAEKNIENLKAMKECALQLRNSARDLRQIVEGTREAIRPIVEQYQSGPKPQNYSEKEGN